MRVPLSNAYSFAAFGFESVVILQSFCRAAESRYQIAIHCTHRNVFKRPEVQNGDENNALDRRALVIDNALSAALL